MSNNNHINTGAVSALLGSLDGDGNLPPEQPAGDKKPPEKQPKKEPVAKAAKTPLDEEEVELETDPIHDDDDGAEEEIDATKQKKSGEEEEVDYDRQIPLADGSTASIGELKDAYQSQREHELDMQEREAKMIEHSVEAQRVLKYFDSLPPQLRYRAAAEIDEHVRRESAGVLDVIPSWRHEDARAADVVLIQDLAKVYNLGPEIAAELKQPTDRRIVKLIRDFARLRAHVKQARANAKVAPQPSSQIKPTRQATRSVADAEAKAATAKRTRSQPDQLAAISALLK